MTLSSSRSSSATKVDIISVNNHSVQLGGFNCALHTSAVARGPADLTTPRNEWTPGNYVFAIRNNCAQQMFIMSGTILSRGGKGPARSTSIAGGHAQTCPLGSWQYCGGVPGGTNKAGIMTIELIDEIFGLVHRAGAQVLE